MDLVCKHVEQHLAVALRPHVSVEEGARRIEQLTELIAVCKVTVVDEEDSKGGVHKKGLSLLGTGGAGSGVAYMPDAGGACISSSAFIFEVNRLIS